MSEKKEWDWTMRMWAGQYRQNSEHSRERSWAKVVIGKKFRGYQELDQCHGFMYRRFGNKQVGIDDGQHRAAALAFIQAAEKGGVKIGDVIRNSYNKALYRVVSLSPCFYTDYFITEKKKDAEKAILLKIKKEKIYKGPGEIFQKLRKADVRRTSFRIYNPFKK